MEQFSTGSLTGWKPVPHISIWLLDVCNGRALAAVPARPCKHGCVNLCGASPAQHFGALIQRGTGCTNIVNQQQPGIMQLDTATKCKCTAYVLDPLGVIQTDLVWAGAQPSQNAGEGKIHDPCNGFGDVVGCVEGPAKLAPPMRRDAYNRFNVLEPLRVTDRLCEPFSQDGSEVFSIVVLIATNELFEITSVRRDTNGAPGRKPAPAALGASPLGYLKAGDRCGAVGARLSQPLCFKPQNADQTEVIEPTFKRGMARLAVSWEEKVNRRLAQSSNKLHADILQETHKMSPASQ